MEMYELSNDEIKIGVSSFGAELKSLKDTKTNQEYMWDANPDYWKRTSPVLFPIVGSLQDGAYSFAGKTYAMSQHGFARDMEFALVEKTENELLFALEDTKETREKYPFAFRLEIGYRIEGRNVTVSWKVSNKQDEKMYFSIGGHPAFLCPVHAGEKQTDYKIYFEDAKEITAGILSSHGTLSEKQKTYPLENGYLAITNDLFDEDALIVEHHQAQKVSLCDPSGKAYLTVSFTAPLFGIWSPAKKNAPFVCIEPWYGRCDKEGFNGDLTQREYGNCLEANEQFEQQYTISI
ncbi:MAG: aldose 1-epimerase family protein [Roseburia sp.]|nr:aldose 1-epimerase family protein [Roseburia sp.]